MIRLKINKKEVDVALGTTVAVAILISGTNCIRKSVSGESRGPLCGMGICQECRATVDGKTHTRTCLLLCAEGMKVETL